MPWVDQALCAQVDPDLFFPAKDAKATGAAAKAVCAECEVRTDCLEWALAQGEEFGVWGGVSARARLKMRRQADAA